MLGGTSTLTTILGSAPPADAETSRLRNYAKTAADNGLHLLLIEPGGKTPVDMRSSVQKRTEDTAAQALAREAGRPDWSRVKSKGGVYLATDDPKSLTRYIDRYRKTYGDTAAINMAVAVGPSRLVIVDCDTEEQVTAFLTDSGIPLDTPLPPTVRSPGQQNEDGTWAHYGGGHYWFTLPEDVELPDGTGSLTMPGGYAILWAKRYVLIPPSVRKEGIYYLAGQDYPAPDWILGRIRAHAAGRTDRKVPLGEDAGELASNIDSWSELVSWEDLLEPAGWTIAARPDGCGCPVWTAPGVHASPKSATAHDTGCSYGRYSEVNAPLHIWTDNPGEALEEWIRDHGSKTVTKLQVAAALSYGGDVGTACAELGMIPKDDLGLDTDEVVRDLGLSTSNLDEPMSFESLKSPAVDAALNHAKAQVATEHAQVSTTEPEQPLCVPVRIGEHIPDKATEMLAAEGFVRSDPHAGRMEFTASDPDDGRVLGIEFGTDGIVTALDTNGEPALFVTLTPLPDSGQPVPEQSSAPIAGTYTLSSPDGSTETFDYKGNPIVSGQPVPERSGSDPVSSVPDTAQFTDSGVEIEDGVLEVGDAHMPRIALFDYWRDFPAPEFVVHGILENGGMAAIIGPAGKGKTAVALDMISCISTGQRWHGRATLQQRVLYLPGEGMSGAVQRLLAWEKAHKASVGTSLAIGEGIIRAGAPKTAWEKLVQLVLQNHIGLIVFDTFARMAVGIEENSSTDVGKVIARLDEVRKLTGCTVLLVHHTGKGSDSARGSSALNGALDTELLVSEGWGADIDVPEGVPGVPLNLRPTKQKNAGMTDAQPLLMVPFEDSIVITGPNGEIGDAFDEIAVTKAILPEPSMDTAARIAVELKHYTAQGLTVMEAAQAVDMDEWTARRADANKAWKLAVRKAIDLGMRMELFETLTGKPTGARYVLTGLSVATFRENVIKAGLSD